MGKPKDEESARVEEQEREVGQDGEIKEGREKAGSKKDRGRSVGREWGGWSRGQEAFDIDEIQQVGGVSLKDGRESGRGGGGRREGREREWV